MFVNLTDQQTDALRTLIDLELGASEFQPDRRMAGVGDAERTA